ncbi:hypothetical protein DEO72_LG3g1392 [Vigna unguiculata]|uniref:Uncharacterized protein n=1 Tax=Vigna unguiculata TaxID=3917 RepID=A0A4D6LF56_VIGUN|nr:hypothetical protein DEO72_LG3g1392 [Vigna unguiculata]
MRASRSRAPSMEVVAGAGARLCGAAGGFGVLRRVPDTVHEAFAISSGASMELFRHGATKNWLHSDKLQRRIDVAVAAVEGGGCGMEMVGEKEN